MAIANLTHKDITTAANDTTPAEVVFKSDGLFIAMVAAGLLQNGVIATTAPATPTTGDWWLDSSAANATTPGVWNYYDGAAWGAVASNIAIAAAVATYTNAGIVQLATPADAAAGTSNNALTPATAAGLTANTALTNALVTSLGASTMTATYTGTTIPDNSTIIAALQALETAVESVPANVQYLGAWNANTNTPTLVNGTGTIGDMYRVSVAGTTNIDGETDWQPGDQIIFNGTTWDKFDNSEAGLSLVAATL